MIRTDEAMGYNSQYWKMRKLFYLLMLILCIIYTSTQNCLAINFIPPTYSTVNSHQGILVENTIVNQDKSITITFRNANSDYGSGEVVTYSFEWYLSYKGKRISDYYTEAIRCGQKNSHTVLYWPGEVPNGNEKYITVQLGREPKKRDRRDDSGAAVY